MPDRTPYSSLEGAILRRVLGVLLIVTGLMASPEHEAPPEMMVVRSASEDYPAGYTFNGLYAAYGQWMSEGDVPSDVIISPVDMGGRTLRIPVREGDIFRQLQFIQPTE